MALLALCAGDAFGQGNRSATVRVTSGGGVPVPFAVVSVDESPFRIAGADGAVTLLLDARDSVRVMVRRIGYRPVDRWAQRSGEAEYTVAMTPIAASLDTVRVVAQMTTPLSKTGFYDRVERVRKSAMLGEFISPEELEARNLSRLSDMLQGRQYSRIATVNDGGRSQPIAQGRARCPMNIVVDGQAVTNTTQDLDVTEVPQSIFGRGTSQGRASAGLRIGLDDIVNGRSIMGIEIYPSIANAPVELIPTASRGACGLIAIWTGPRK